MTNIIKLIEVIMLFIAIYVVPVWLIIFVLSKIKIVEKTPTSIGAYGEELIENYIMNMDIGYKKILRNVLIKNTYTNKITEIDLILLHVTGIYVIESKNYSGWIFGNQYQEEWTQTFSKNNKYKFYNPLKQNYGHIQALRKLLRYDNDSCFVSYIIFSNRCELKKVPQNTDTTRILKRDWLYKTLREDIEKRRILFTQEQLERIYTTINNSTISILNNVVRTAEENRH